MPLRHVELGANMNNSKIAGDVNATTVSQMHIYTAMDRLGIGQYLSRIALMLDGSTGAALDESKCYWMDDELWQPMRKLVEDTLVVDDWFELTLVQNVPGGWPAVSPGVREDGPVAGRAGCRRCFHAHRIHAGTGTRNPCAGPTP